MKCIVCKDDIKEIMYSDYTYYLGVVDNIMPVYGSEHDLRKIKVGICDQCISNAEKENTIEIVEEDVNPYDV
jgi:hypothetical protein